MKNVVVLQITLTFSYYVLDCFFFIFHLLHWANFYCYAHVANITDYQLKPGYAVLLCQNTFCLLCCNWFSKAAISQDNEADVQISMVVVANSCKGVLV